jgi:TonB-dependent SusC/RagA subfamily outer membrane receptor
MRSLLYYLLQMTIASGILYAYYHFALRNTKFHRYNRFYILAAIIISVLIPFINIPIYFTAAERQSSLVFQTLTVFSTSQSDAVISTHAVDRIIKTNWFTLPNILTGLYILISSFALARIIISLKKIRHIIQTNPVEELQDIHFVNTNEPGTPYSFFRWLFWNRKIELRSEKGEQIFRHELFHIKEKHSWDILFTELLNVIYWINPFFHLLKKELKAIHEFLADQFAVSENQKWKYAELLLMQALSTQHHLTNPFFHNQIKRRIAMLTTSTKPGHQYLRKVLVLPVAAIVLALFAFKYKEKENSQNHLPAGKTFTVVIDAGHGGSEFGVTGSDGVLEKNIVLAIAQKVKLLNADDNLKIVLTRDADATIPLQDRTALSNNENADLFVSLHINAQAQKSESPNAASGIEVYIPAHNKTFYSENRILASILLNYFAQLYTVNGSIQHRDKKIWVLENTNCPSAMVELGYMNNNDDLHFIEQTDNQEKIAKAILQTIDQYFLQKGSDDWEERKKDVIDTVSALSQIAQKQGLKSNGAIVIGGKPGNSYSFVSDSIIFKSDSKNPELKDALIVLNGKRTAAETISNKTVIAKSVTIYPENDPQAIRKFGDAAKKGVLVFEDAKIQELFENSFQKKDTINPDNKIFEKVEVEPSFPGGEPEWKKYLKRNLSGVNPAIKGAPNRAYTVFVQFVVDKEGYISDVKALTHYGYGMEEAAVRVIKKGPYWNPATQNGRKVKAYKKVPITFDISDGKTSIRSVIIHEVTLQPKTKPENSDFQKALVVIDGVEYPGMNQEELNKKVPAQDIASIEIIKDGASAQYGEKGRNGVIKITTKKSKTEKIKEVTLTEKKSGDNKIFEKVEVAPSFPGGHQAWERYLERTLSNFNPADSGASEGTYTVIAQFIVDKEGNVSDVKTLTHFGYGMEDTVIKMINNGPKWEPAIQNGRKVTAYVKQPVTFVITDEDDIPVKNVSQNKKEVTIVDFTKKGTKANNNESNTLKKEDFNRLSAIYPNPTNNSVTIPFKSEKEGKGEIRIYDETGNLKITSPASFMKGSNNFNVNIASLAKGVYIINVIGANKTTAASYKMIKE